MHRTIIINYGEQYFERLYIALQNICNLYFAKIYYKVNLKRAPFFLHYFLDIVHFFAALNLSRLLQLGCPQISKNSCYEFR